MGMADEEHKEWLNDENIRKEAGRFRPRFKPQGAKDEEDECVTKYEVKKDDEDDDDDDDEDIGLDEKDDSDADRE